MLACGFKVDKEPSINTAANCLVVMTGCFNVFLFAMDFFSCVAKTKGGKKFSKNFSQKSSKGVQDNEIGKPLAHTFSSCSTGHHPQGGSSPFHSADI
jgi:hypothetical protein